MNLLDITLIKVVKFLIKNIFFFIYFNFLTFPFIKNKKLFGDWGLGIGDWGLGIGRNRPARMANRSSPKPNPPPFNTQQ